MDYSGKMSMIVHCLLAPDSYQVLDDVYFYGQYMDYKTANVEITAVITGIIVLLLESWLDYWLEFYSLPCHKSDSIQPFRTDSHMIILKFSG